MVSRGTPPETFGVVRRSRPREHEPVGMGFRAAVEKQERRTAKIDRAARVAIAVSVAVAIAVVLFNVIGAFR
jgi:hypothetical protein